MEKKFKIPVTKPFMPPREEYEKYLKGIWEREYITNNGPLVQELEKKLINYLDVSDLLFTTNGTVALQIAIKALGLKGEVITTPFSYVATTSSLVWEGCKPIFVDIDPDTLNINPALIEEAITEKTTCILATHVFGNPCDIDTIRDIADRHNLKVIYDAAHCFGSKYKGKSVFAYGDISTASFHATKIFHTVEGGAVISNNEDLMERMAYMRNFGHDGPGKFNGVGINGKNSEYHAAMGLCNLQYIDDVLSIRKKQYKTYDDLLRETDLETQKIDEGTEYNYSYFPILLKNEEDTIKCKIDLEKKGIGPRRYFYPSLNELSYVEGDCPISVDISERILCLPLYNDLEVGEQKKVIKVILKTFSLC